MLKKIKKYETLNTRTGERIYNRVKFAAYQSTFMIYLFNFLKKCQTFPKRLILYSHHQRRILISLHSYQHLLSDFHSSHHSGCYCVIYISLIIKGAEYLFTCLLAMFIFFGEMSSQIICTF